MRQILERKITVLNRILDNPIAPWNPDTGVTEGCLMIDTSDPVDRLKAYHIVESSKVRGNIKALSDRVSGKDMHAFIDGAIFGAMKLKQKFPSI